MIKAQREKPWAEVAQMMEEAVRSACAAVEELKIVLTTAQERADLDQTQLLGNSEPDVPFRHIK